MLVDTNLFVGFLVGSLLGKAHLKDCRATKAFALDDFDLLHGILSQFTKLITTPHILTEVSNLTGRLETKLLKEFRAKFSAVIVKLEEENVSAARIASHDDFIHLGIADTAISLIAPGRYLVITDEFELYGRLQKRGVDVINFNHIRSLAW